MPTAARTRFCLLSFVLALVCPVAALAVPQYNMVPGVSIISREIFSLHMIIFWISVAIAVVVFAVMLWAIIFHRKSKGAQASSFHENTTIEIIWTTIPFLILIAMAIPATKVLVQMNDLRDADITLKVTGYQWKWHYDYLNENIGFFSNLLSTQDQINNRVPKSEHYLQEVDNKVVLPVGKKIRILTTSNDVLHSWWVPVLGVKKDAIPGFINETWTEIDEPGIYRGQCAELCGANHGYMPIVVEAVSQQDYAAWVQKMQAAQKK